MSIIITQDTLNYIFKTDASKLEHIMGEGYDKKTIGENDHYYIIQDTIVEEDNTTDKNVAVCKPTTFTILKQ